MKRKYAVRNAFRLYSCVGGTAFIRGGGSNSIHIVGGQFNNIILDSRTNTHLNLSGSAEVDRIYLKSSASITYNAATINYDAKTDTVTFGGVIDKINLHANGSATVTIAGIVYEIIPPENTIAKFALEAGSIVKEMVLESGVNIAGNGRIDKMEVHENGVIIDKSVNVKPENIWAEDNVKIRIGNETYTGGDDYPDRKPSDNGSPIYDNDSSDDDSGSYTPSNPLTNRTVNIALMSLTASYGTISGATSVTAASITKAQLVTPNSDYYIEGWYTTNNPAGTKAIFPIAANATVYARLEAIPANKFSVTTPGSITANGVTTTVTFDKTGPQSAETAVKETVTLTGTTVNQGLFSINLTSAKASLSGAAQVRNANSPITMASSDKFDFTFTMPAQNVDELVLSFTFAQTFRVTYDKNGGDNITFQNYTDSDTSGNATVTADIPTHATKTFIGWNTEAALIFPSHYQ